MASKEAGVNRVSYFGRVLPVEILHMILSKLALSQKKKARLVCNLWRRILDTPELGGLTFRANITNASVLPLLRTCRKIDRVTVRGVTKRLPRMASANNRYPHIKKAVFGWKNSEATIKSFLALGTASVESLKILNFALENVRPKVIGDIVQTIDWSRLTKLKLSISIGHQKSENHVNATISLMEFATFPNLEVFEFDLSRSYQHGRQSQPILLTKICVQFYVFLVAHSDSLTILNCGLTVFAWHGERAFEVPAISPKLKQDLSKLKIEECLIESRGQAFALESMVLPCLMTGTLKRFKLFSKLRGFGRFRNWLSAGDFANFFDVNGKTLEEIEIQSNFDFGVDLYFVPVCTGLKSLKIWEAVVEGPGDTAEFSRVIPLTLNVLEIPAIGLPMIHSANRERIQHVTDLTLWNVTEEPDDNLNSLTDFVGLKSLHLTDLSISAVELLALKEAVFPNLIQLRVDKKWNRNPFQNTNEQFDPNLEFPKWVLQAMPAIEVLKVGHVIGLQYLRMLLNLPKLQKLDFFRPVPELNEYCDHQPGLKLSPIRPEMKRRPHHRDSFRWRITVRNRTNFQS